jgi:hypothetical protein
LSIAVCFLHFLFSIRYLIWAVWLFVGIVPLFLSDIYFTFL